MCVLSVRFSSKLRRDPLVFSDAEVVFLDGALLTESWGLTSLSRFGDSEAPTREEGTRGLALAVATVLLAV